MINQKKSKTLVGRTVVSGLFAAFLAATSFAYADAGHGTVKFVGEIIDAACSIDPESMDQTVELGQISTQTLEKYGESETHPFNIHLEGCSSSTAKAILVTFNGHAADSDKTRMSVEGTAKGVAIQLKNQQSGESMVLGQPTKIMDLIDGDNTLNFGAKMVSLPWGPDGADVVPGQFMATANFVISYQ